MKTSHFKITISILITLVMGSVGCEYYSPTERVVERASSDTVPPVADDEEETIKPPAGELMAESESMKALENRIAELQNQLANSASFDDSERI